MWRNLADDQFVLEVPDAETAKPISVQRVKVPLDYSPLEHPLAQIGTDGGKPQSAGAPTFTISNAGTVTEGGNAEFKVKMSGTITSNVTIWYSTYKGTASSTAGDYSDKFVNVPLTFTPNGSTTKTTRRCI